MYSRPDFIGHFSLTLMSPWPGALWPLFPHALLRQNATYVWLSTVASKQFGSEKEVEIRFVIPLLDRLGYGEDDRADGYPVDQVVGVRKIRTEADFVLFDGRNRTRDNALLVVEAKSAGKRLADYVQQARSYAMFLGTPYFLVTNGDDIRVYLYRSPIESDIEVYRVSRGDLAATFPALFNLIGKPAIIEYKRRRSAPR